MELKGQKKFVSPDREKTDAEKTQSSIIQILGGIDECFKTNTITSVALNTPSRRVSVLVYPSSGAAHDQLLAETAQKGFENGKN